jgi:hypothetical protein
MFHGTLEGEVGMFKNKLVAAVIIAAFFLILVPAPSRATSRTWTLFPDPAAGLFSKLERWWNLVVAGPERPARPEPSPVWQKNGCGIDPCGHCSCGPGPVPGQATEPADSAVK